MPDITDKKQLYLTVNGLVHESIQRIAVEIQPLLILHVLCTNKLVNSNSPDC